MLYIREQFDLRHFRRDRITSEYIDKEQNIQRNILHSNANDMFDGNTFDVDDEDSFMTQEKVIDNECDSDFDSSTGILSDNNDEIEADNFLTPKEKQASYYEQECYQRGKTKSLDASELRKIFKFCII